MFLHQQCTQTYCSATCFYCLIAYLGISSLSVHKVLSSSPSSCIAFVVWWTLGCFRPLTFQTVREKFCTWGTGLQASILRVGLQVRGCERWLSCRLNRHQSAFPDASPICSSPSVQSTLRCSLSQACSPPVTGHCWCHLFSYRALSLSL